MGRRRSAALRDVAGVYHVASRLAYEGFHATVARGAGTGTDVLAGLPGASDTVAIAVRTTECPPHRGCEWRVGKGAALAEDPDLLVALVDLKDGEELPGMWVVPSARIRDHFASLEEPGRYRYRPAVEELVPYENNWGLVEEHLLGSRAPRRKGWFTKEEIEERYGEEFVGAVDAEASRLLGTQNSTIRQMADERFPAEELAEASALLSVLFRRWMEGVRLERLKKGPERG